MLPRPTESLNLGPAARLRFPPATYATLQQIPSDPQWLDTGPGLLFIAPITDNARKEVVRVLLIEVNLQSVVGVVENFGKSLKLEQQT